MFNNVSFNLSSPSLRVSCKSIPANTSKLVSNVVLLVNNAPSLKVPSVTLPMIKPLPEDCPKLAEETGSHVLPVQTNAESCGIF